MGVLGFFDKEVIEWKDASQNTIVYRFPTNPKKDIMNNSSLTVRESQMAVFVNKGEIADIFGPGMYRLSTDMFPILKKLGAIGFQGKNRWQAEVYFVNTKQFTNQKWGTTNPITLRDQDFGMVRIRGYGVYSFRVADSGVFLKELFGTNSTFKTEDINEYFKSLLVSGITDTIAESRVSALDLASNLQEFNKLCVKEMSEEFTKLGLQLVNFTIENISFPKEIEAALDERTRLGILGDKADVYTKLKAADALGDAAKNQGTVGTFMGIGVGQGLGNMMGGVLGQSSGGGASTGGKGKFCTECGTKLDGNSKFCPNCGSKL